MVDRAEVVFGIGIVTGFKGFEVADLVEDSEDGGGGERGDVAGDDAKAGQGRVSSAEGGCACAWYR